VQRGVREHDIPRARFVEGRDVGRFEPHRIGSVSGCRGQHRGRVVETDDFSGAEETGQLGREAPRATAKIDYAASRDRGEERNEIEERLAALPREPIVLLRVLDAGHASILCASAPYQLMSYKFPKRAGRENRPDANRSFGPGPIGLPPIP
jgi:hypothetical protein